jgi:AcrR family transcriptional regulator
VSKGGVAGVFWLTSRVEGNTEAHVPARERLLAAASRVFYAEGIHDVPVDRVIAEARVTRATFYRHFPGKEDLVRTYLLKRDVDIRTAAGRAAAGGGGPAAMLRALVDGIEADVCQPGFRGCPFINAAAEYPDPTHPVRVVVAEHREWFRNTLVEVVTALGHDEPEIAADALVMLRDGAMVGGYLDDPDRIVARLSGAVRSVVGAH